ncbi:MAG: hypothetical protein WC662_02325 [Candidatus Paceibacterota bacterium]|jgi:hypothetical protein
MEQKHNLVEEKEQGYNSQEISRFKFPRIELREDGILLVNEKLIEGLPPIDGYHINPDGKNIVAYKHPKFNNNKEKEDAELMTREGYRSGVWPGRVLHVLEHEGENKDEYKIKSTEEDCVFNEHESKKTKQIIASKDYLDNNKDKQHIPAVDGISYEHLRNCYLIDDNRDYENLLQFGNREGKIFVVNAKNLTQNIKIENKKEDHDYKINGHTWESLKSKDIYFGGYRVKIDFNNEKIMFCSVKEGQSSHHEYNYVVNSREWKFSSEDYSNFDIQNNLAFVLTNNTLIIEDKKWNEKPIVTKEGDHEYQQLEHTALGGKDEKIAVTNQCNINNKLVHEIIEGDINGPNHVWKNKIAVEKIIAGKNIIAVVGKTENGEPSLFINDILIKLKDNIVAFLDLKIKEDEVSVTYKTAMGEVVSVSCKLEEGAENYEKSRIEKEKQNEALHQLTNIIFEQGLNPQDFIEKYKKNQIENEELKTKTENQNKTINRLSEEKNQVDISLQNQKALLEQEQRKTKNSELKLETVESYLKTIKPILEGLKTGMGSSFKISPDNLKTIKENLDSAIRSSQTQ